MIASFTGNSDCRNKGIWFGISWVELDSVSDGMMDDVLLSDSEGVDNGTLLDDNKEISIGNTYSLLEGMDRNLKYSISDLYVNKDINNESEGLFNRISKGIFVRIIRGTSD